MTSRLEFYLITLLCVTFVPAVASSQDLSGLSICIDPGHGAGNANQGPTGLREANIDLDVSLFLKEFLKSAHIDTVLLTRIDEVWDTQCTSIWVGVDTIDLWVGQAWCPPTVGPFAPFCPNPAHNPFVDVSFPADIPALGITGGQAATMEHTEGLIAHPFMHHYGYDIYVEPGVAAGLPFVSLDIMSDLWWSVSNASGSFADPPVPSCTHDTVYAHPRQSLRWLLQFE